MFIHNEIEIELVIFHNQIYFRLYSHIFVKHVPKRTELEDVSQFHFNLMILKHFIIIIEKCLLEMSPVVMARI